MRLFVRFFPLAVLGLLVAAPAAVAQAPANIRLATWNIGWLTERLPAGVHRRTPEDIALLQKYARRIDADIVAFQGVDGLADAGKVFDPSLYDLHTTGEPDVQKPGFAVRKGIVLVRNPDLAELDVLADQPPALSRGADITVTLAGQQVRMLAVQLQSGCAEQPLDSGSSECSLLGRQLPVLRQWIAERVREGVSFVVLGAFNRVLGPQEEFSRGINVDIGAAGLRRASAVHKPDQPACWGRQQANFTDDILFGGPARRGVDGPSFRVLAYDEKGPAFRKKISEHCPLLIAFRPLPPVAMVRSAGPTAGPQRPSDIPAFGAEAPPRAKPRMSRHRFDAAPTDRMTVPEVLPDAQSVGPPPEPRTVPETEADRASAPKRPKARGKGRSAPRGPLRAAYWNTWLQSGEEAPPVLKTGSRYTFVLDIAPHEYASLRRAAAAQSMRTDAAVQEALEKSDAKEVKFVVTPLIAEGSGLSFPARVEPLTLTVELDKLREQDDDKLQEEQAAQVAKYVAGDLSLPDFAKEVSAGRISFEVSAETAGCSAIVLSIWSANGRLPLDHLTRWVSIAEEGQTDAACEAVAAGRQRLMTGGLKTLLDTSLAIQAGAAIETAAAAFHIFNSRAGSFVVFVDGRPGAAPAIRSWQTISSLADYLSNPRELTEMITAARKAATDGTAGSYVPAAQELAAKLFRGQAKGDAEARAARKAFQELVAQSPHERPVVVAKVMSDELVGSGQNRTLFLPLGIVGARGDGAVLAKPITVVQPLPRERYGSASTCIGDWTFGIPAKLDRADIPPIAHKAAGTWLDTLARLKSYLSEDNTLPAEGAGGQGFLLLAHHDRGNVWFDNQAQRVVREDIMRSYPAGSLAIFAACSATVPSEGNSLLLQEFNARGVDAVIASPFPIPAEYGTRLAVGFAEVVAQEREAGRTPSVAELFEKVVKATAEQFAREGSRYEEMGLEYVLLGDPSLKLCGPGQKAQP